MAAPTTALANSDTIVKVTDEKFAEIHTSDENNVKVLDDQRTFVNSKFGACACAVGIHSYSSGIHSIRIMVRRGRPILGIRSRNIPPVANEHLRGSYGVDRSTYGFERDLGHVLNGRLRRRNYEDMRLDHSNSICTLIINCDEHRLCLIDEDSGEVDQVTVDILQAPFPWCFFIALPQSTAKVTLL